MKTFNVPVHYRSPLISRIKEERRSADKLKKDFSPTSLSYGNLHIWLARHFGFCYGVENAIEIAFRAVDENPGKRIFLLSEMIHNPGVNADLLSRGVQFLMDTKGHRLMNWNELNKEDVVIIPAFGTTLEVEAELKERGLNPTTYETTCPFVEKVWNRAEKIGADGYTVVVHGKPDHEETKATFSHSQSATPTLVVKDMAEAQLLGKIINGTRPLDLFYEDFKGQYSEGFDIFKDLQRIGVVNQTTMLASETQAIADHLKQIMIGVYGLAHIKAHFADTRDTLCYATNDNQTAVQHLLKVEADMALVIGGYNSSNTSHLVELCEEKLATYFIENAQCLTEEGIHHFEWKSKTHHRTTRIWTNDPLKVLITSGASCPDALVEEVIDKLSQLTGN